ncbi:hypothetical protein [Vannielia litorea]|uniref:Uncharacterized protein n=1 Tax=Vannielia litorea TaxID=1217970 RepID=A0A1N6ECP8_9RHOB|nr:hypothetical protein [Vannielia litorea]SIN80786.1 hypothetical protein SAMN05444002_0600 [Vannielia litorea]
MSIGKRALLAHALGFVAGVGAAWALTYLFSGLVLGEGSGVAMLALVAFGAGVAGFAVWTLVVTRMLPIRADGRWWALGVASVVGLMVVATGIMALGVFNPPQTLVLMLFLLFALGGWATHGRMTGEG